MSSPTLEAHVFQLWELLLNHYFDNLPSVFSILPFWNFYYSDAELSLIFFSSLFSISFLFFGSTFSEISFNFIFWFLSFWDSPPWISLLLLPFPLQIQILAFFRLEYSFSLIHLLSYFKFCCIFSFTTLLALLGLWEFQEKPVVNTCVQSTMYNKDPCFSLSKITMLLLKATWPALSYREKIKYKKV